MKTFIEEMLHQKVELRQYNELEKLPLMFRSDYDFYIMEIAGQQCILVEPLQETGLTMLRKQQKRLEGLMERRCVLYLTKMNYYARDKMLEEGIPFIWEGRQIYMPFLGVLLDQNENRRLQPGSRVSFLTQKLLLTAIYQDWNGVTVTMAAEKLVVTKVSITRCFDEIECMGIPVLEKKGRSRMIRCVHGRRETWEIIKPFLRTPLIEEFYLEKNIEEKLVMSGISALSMFSMLGDNAYPTYAVTKGEMKNYRVREQRQVLGEDIPGCVVQELGYVIPFMDRKAVDPLTVFLLLEQKSEDPRIEIALEEMLEEYVW